MVSRTLLDQIENILDLNDLYSTPRLPDPRVIPLYWQLSTDVLSAIDSYHIISFSLIILTIECNRHVDMVTIYIDTANNSR